MVARLTPPSAGSSVSSSHCREQLVGSSLRPCTTTLSALPYALAPPLPGGHTLLSFFRTSLKTLGEIAAESQTSMQTTPFHAAATRWLNATTNPSSIPNNSNTVFDAGYQIGIFAFSLPNKNIDATTVRFRYLTTCSGAPSGPVAHSATSHVVSVCGSSASATNLLVIGFDLVGFPKPLCFAELFFRHFAWPTLPSPLPDPARFDALPIFSVTELLLLVNLFFFFSLLCALMPEPGTRKKNKHASNKERKHKARHKASNQASKQRALCAIAPSTQRAKHPQAQSPIQKHPSPRRCHTVPEKPFWCLRREPEKKQARKKEKRTASV